MTTIEQLLFDNSQKLYEGNKQETKTEGNEPASKKFENDIIRKDKKDLYQMYVSNPIVFNTINKYVQLIMSPGFQFKAEDKDVENFFYGFYDNIGYSGSETDQYDLMAETFRHSFIGGEAWQENIYNKTGKKIVDLDIINPLSMDYARDASKKMVLDNYSNPVGFTQTIPTDEPIELLQKFPIPENVSIGHDKLFLPPERITHFKLYKVGDGFSGLGLVEPIYNSSIRKLNSEKGFSESAARLGSPIITAKIGDSLHEPTPQQIKNTLDEISKVNQKSAFAHPYTTELKLLEPRKPEKLKEYLDYFEAVEVTGMGMPGAFSSGSGEATNRSTLARQEYLLKLSLKEIIRRITRTIEQKQLKVIAKQYHLKEVPRIVWGEISLEELDSKSQRLVAYANAGLLSKSPGLEKVIRELERLPSLIDNKQE
jgi:hypothetical protein